jgi:hypothetical protein
MDEWMKEMFGAKDPEDPRSRMGGMSSMMVQWGSAVDTEQLDAWMEERLPGMMEWCLSYLDTEG